jgi:hypothetical protein
MNLIRIQLCIRDEQRPRPREDFSASIDKPSSYMHNNTNPKLARTNKLPAYTHTPN